MTSFLNGVRGVFRRHPFLANSAIYGSLYVAAEYSQQYLVKRVLPETEAEKKDIDYATIGRYAVMGTTVFAPTLYTWFVVIHVFILFGKGYSQVGKISCLTKINNY